MLKVGAAALVLCGLMTAPSFAAPLAGVEAQFYPNEYNQPDTSAVSDDLVKSSDSNGVISDSDLKNMSGGSGITVKGDLQLNLPISSSSVDGNYIAGVDTGTIGAQSLNNISGINTIMQNTGNGVSMQSINNVNITLN